MNKFKKADIFNSVEKRITFWTKLRDIEISEIISKYSVKGRKGFLGFFERNTFIPTKKEAINLYNDDHMFGCLRQNNWIKKAKNFLEYVEEANGLDSDYVYLTEAQYEEWG